MHLIKFYGFITLECRRFRAAHILCRSLFCNLFCELFQRNPTQMLFTKSNNKVSVSFMPCNRCKIALNVRTLFLCYIFHSIGSLIWWKCVKVLETLHNALCSHLPIPLIRFLSSSAFCLRCCHLRLFAEKMSKKCDEINRESAKKWSCVNIIRHSFAALCWCLINKHVHDVRRSLPHASHHSNAKIWISAENSNAIHCNAVIGLAGNVWTVQIRVTLEILPLAIYCLLSYVKYHLSFSIRAFKMSVRCMPMPHCWQIT